MPKVRNSNVAPDVKPDYLYCGKQKNHPRIHHLICEQRCRYKKKCVYYKTWLDKPEKKEDPKKKKTTTRRRKSTAKRKPRRKE